MIRAEFSDGCAIGVATEFGELKRCDKMDSERLKQIEEIYHAALDVPFAERESFIKKLCGADADLRREVESLLQFDKTFDERLDAPPDALAAEVINERAQLNSLTDKKIGGYLVKKLLGRGGMGEVYLAEDTRLNRRVALKILPADFAADASRLKRFEQEARAVSALNHPNILTVHEFGADDGAHFLVTEFVEGETLREKIRNGDLLLNDALGIAEQTAFALSAAHARDIAHRDIKPENIMIRHDGIVKVLDFGIAKLIAPPADSIDGEGETTAQKMTGTKPGMLLGTLNYMSPEQVRGQKIDARSDIFSLGVVLYEMLTGAEPFDKPTSSDVIAAILTEQPPPLTEVKPAAPAELERIVNKALRKNKDERYQTSNDLLLDIKRLRRTIEFSAERLPTAAENGARSTNADKIHATLAAPIRLFNFLYAIVIFLVASLTIGGAFWFFGKRNSPAETVQSAAPSSVEVVNWRGAPGEIYSVGAFSPDAKMIAFTSTKVGGKNIWVKQTAGGEAVQITRDEFTNQNPVWSPNGDELAFFTTRGGTSAIWRMPSLGGNPTFVKAVEGGAILRRWSRKDLIYFEVQGNLFALDLKSGQASSLTDFDAAKINPDSFSVSPDEEQIAYVAFENDQYAVYTMPASGGAVKKIVGSADEIRNAVWHADGKRILYSQNTGGAFQIFAASADGGNPAQITFGERDAFALDVSADGAKILYGASKEESDVWGVNVEKAEEFPFASDINAELWAAVSPDNKTVAYQSIKNLSQGDKLFLGAILTRQIDSDAPPFQITASGGLPVWSPDGKRLAFIRLANDAYNLWTINGGGGEEKQLTNNGLPSVEFTTLPYNRTQTESFSWSPDGKNIAYISGGGARNIWSVDADNEAGKIALTNNLDSNISVSCPLWSADGKHMAYSSKSEAVSATGKISYTTVVIDLATKNAKIVAQSENFQRLLGWSPSDKEIILAALGNKSGTGKPTEVGIVQVSVETGRQTPLLKLEAVYLYNIYLSADKKMLAYVSNKDGKDNIWIARLSGGAPRKITSNNDAKLYFSTLSWSPDDRTIYFGKQTRYSLLSMVTNFK